MTLIKATYITLIPVVILGVAALLMPALAPRAIEAPPIPVMPAELATPEITTPIAPPSMARAPSPLPRPEVAEEVAPIAHHVARRRLGPLHTQEYTAMSQSPEVHGYITMDLDKVGGGVDTFKFRQRIEVDPFIGALPAVTYRDALRLLPTFNEVEVQDLDIQFMEPLAEFDPTDTPSLHHILVTWREVTLQ